MPHSLQQRVTYCFEALLQLGLELGISVYKFSPTAANKHCRITN